MSEKNEALTEQEKLRYLQTKIHEAVLECINTYILFRNATPLIDSSTAYLFMDFRNSIETNIGFTDRYKSYQSAIDNISKEVMKKINKLSHDCSTEEIDKIVPPIVNDVIKDFIGATLVFHSQNELKTYCESSDDPTIKKLYNQLKSVDEYLIKSKNAKNTTIISKFFNKFKFTNISNTFVDDAPNPKSPKYLKLLDIDSIKTPKDYYTQLINLLTLLTNISMPCTDSSPDNPHKYSVGQLDISYFCLVEQAQAKNPKSNDEFIEILTKLAREAYHIKDSTKTDKNGNKEYDGYDPFDIQLEKALEERDIAKKSSNYTKPLSKSDRISYIHHLSHLKNNLQMAKDDRLINYILKIEIPNIIAKLSDLTNLQHVEIISQKETSKLNGFYSQYYIMKIDNLIELELQTRSEFRDKIAKEGNAAHNSMPGKSFDFRHLFELAPSPFKVDKTSEEKQIKFYCDFLETVNLNFLTDYKIPKEKLPYLKTLRELVNYASSKIQVKDFVECDGESVPFYTYITRQINLKGAKFKSIYPAHRIEHNQALVVPQNAMFSLETLLKSRIGFSALANLVRIKYKEHSTNRGEKILPDDPTLAYSPTLTDPYDLSRDNLEVQTAIENFEPLSIPFTPMGQSSRNSSSTSSKNKDDDVQEI